ncbi:histidine phosphatase family protein [Roseateles amylovorans]|uniref:Histidine phosphatase family protein n=1 Tax=Roseateles amylovorans TaxID=2978473 RepID=A0ABY6AU31_9BURK|nr:histidine phosphatase family protein [Roseateles amylovorans]UXH76080.1 histidine phosphatase family protein [Roseateles amylovorans]
MRTSDMDICLVRHGETDWSLTGQHTGITDLGLTHHGQAQARRLAPRLRQLGIDHVRVSPRLRAQQTCALAGFADRSEIDPDLAEWDYGAYEGRRTVDILREVPDWDIWRDGCPGGETPEAVQHRIDRLLLRLARLSGRVALFAHGQLGAALAARWIGLPVSAGQHFSLQTASVSLLGVDPRRPDRRRIDLWNEAPPAEGKDGAA